MKYTFEAKIWRYNSTGGWHFVSMPLEMTAEIQSLYPKEGKEWGRYPIAACIDDVMWQTSMWYDSKHKTFLIPLKADIRHQLHIREGDIVYITIKL